ncbi:MAG TPA: hypothetical protein VK488_07450 [Gaiellaceae bacterium]|nr:hypothetical protein [Gaiellaceae bacterium]
MRPAFGRFGFFGAPGWGRAFGPFGCFVFAGRGLAFAFGRFSVFGFFVPAGLVFWPFSFFGFVSLSACSGADELTPSVDSD